MPDVKSIADKADIIINGYAFTRKRGRKLLNAGELAEPRFSQFLKLLELCNKYRRKNQYE